ncbi:glutathione peroxidase [Crenobacter sp. SG2305]|uniref:glutathione peroxidase n=1 Tax=Crenobacter oryzisoli TaxID=3056844 RepID=UPI0025AB35B1|nr:glutathione peroxidase [Crenobacter sp. SG2305]MDN0082631.1 glutathione peroxidase [Crenobacter sp. SG2305]
MSDSPIYRFHAATLDGREMNLADYRGQVLLIVNTASQCGFTPQYAGLDQLYRQYHERGLTVIGFPCNQFGQQEPGSASEIGAFCQKNYGVSFPMADKVDVNGPTAHPLWQYLTSTKRGFFGTRKVKWNFTKFLINRDGRVVARFGSLTKPEALTRHIEKLL